MTEMLDWISWFSIKYTYLFIIILTLAALEVQIEGKFGWTKKLPTWRIKSRVFGFFMGGKELTGYLFYLLVLLLLFFHMPFVLGVPWTFQAEVEIFIVYILFSVFWDFLWFVLNPYYGMKRFKKSYVYWHHHWVLGIPLDYPRGIMISFMIAFLDYPNAIGKWALMMAIFLVGTIVVMVINNLVRRRPAYEDRHWYVWKK